MSRARVFIGWTRVTAEAPFRLLEGNNISSRTNVRFRPIAVIRMTKELIEAGRHMRVTVHDHVIVGSQGRKSMKSMGLI